MTQYEIEWIERDIIERLNKGEKVFIESGAANDEITAYSIRKYKTHSWQSYEEKEITFTTTACIFPEKILAPHELIQIGFQDEYTSMSYLHI